MESDKFGPSGALQIEKIFDYNYHVWKQRIELVLAYREVDDAIFKENAFQRDRPEFAKWNQSDKMACAIIGLSLFDDMLEHVREFETRIQMLHDIKKVFHRHTILNKLRARRSFYTVEMNLNQNC